LINLTKCEIRSVLFGPHGRVEEWNLTNLVDMVNQLPATATVHFNRNEKEFFPGIFWIIDIILTNCWKIYESLCGPFLSPIGKK
jgi:hypothetical protein